MVGFFLSSRNDELNPVCEQCLNGGGTLLRCDFCTSSYHLGCAALDEEVPAVGVWACPDCVHDQCNILGDATEERKISKAKE